VSQIHDSDIAHVRRREFVTGNGSMLQAPEVILIIGPNVVRTACACARKHARSACLNPCNQIVFASRPISYLLLGVTMSLLYHATDSIGTWCVLGSWCWHSAMTRVMFGSTCHRETACCQYSPFSRRRCICSNMNCLPPVSLQKRIGGFAHRLALVRDCPVRRHRLDTRKPPSHHIGGAP
jgi:hypothetical protein